MKRVFPWAIAFALLLVGLALFLPGGRQPDPANTDLPWLAEALPNGHTRLLGLELGQSTLADAEHKFQEEAVVSLFVAEGGRKVVESFFKDVSLAGLRAEIVLELELNDVQLNQIYERGARIATLGSGQRKVTLGGEDVAQVRQAQIRSLTYLPAANLDAELVRKRFGQPKEVLREKNKEVEHWLYPAVGLDIAVSQQEKEVMQFVLPKDFDELVKPLHSVGQ